MGYPCTTGFLWERLEFIYTIVETFLIFPMLGNTIQIDGITYGSQYRTLCCCKMKGSSKIKTVVNQINGDDFIRNHNS